MADKKKVCVAEDAPEIAQAISDYFTAKDELEVSHVVENGQGAIDAAAEVDVIVLDLIMPVLDGFAVMEHIATLPAENRPEIIVVSALGSEDIVRLACDLGAKYFMVKPFNMANLHKRVLELAGLRKSRHVSKSIAPVSPSRSIDEKITSIFLTVGIPAHIKGYQYLRSAIKMSVEDNSMINRITKQLYPEIARLYDTSPSKVERAIRHAIEVAWTRGKIENINHIFGYNVYTKNDKPTNGEFIALVADKLILEQTA